MKAPSLNELKQDMWLIDTSISYSAVIQITRYEISFSNCAGSNRVGKLEVSLPYLDLDPKHNYVLINDGVAYLLSCVSIDQSTPFITAMYFNISITLNAPPTKIEKDLNKTFLTLNDVSANTILTRSKAAPPTGQAAPVAPPKGRLKQIHLIASMHDTYDAFRCVESTNPNITLGTVYTIQEDQWGDRFIVLDNGVEVEDAGKDAKFVYAGKLIPQAPPAPFGGHYQAQPAPTPVEEPDTDSGGIGKAYKTPKKAYEPENGDNYDRDALWATIKNTRG